MNLAEIISLLTKVGPQLLADAAKFEAGEVISASVGPVEVAVGSEKIEVSAVVSVKKA
jgi:hypothetical protein